MSDEPTVLIVDDEHAITDLHARWLEDSYEVRKAYNGTEALETIDEDVDIVLLDRRMPDRSGQEVLDEIREQAFDCRVAMVTAVEPDFDILELGFDAYICKPVSDPEQLREIVASLEIRSTYDSQVQELLALSSKKAALEERKESDELSKNEDYTELETRLASLRNELSSTAMELDDDDLRAEFHDRNDSGSKLMKSAEGGNASESRD
ncbi:DNA-binding protein [Haladaptatus sp. W1]|uniref:response regulator transcription factor n=1 Tax=Haladaptatus sp. W1 TaxID=1897478 RepID=UPI0008498B63|nr:response regulator [Haladaptatus sp. W1]ODR81791.1 DNA-binding protein [Haladaptatus sp. W1]